MSDRFPQYHQMIPNFNNPASLQQQQQQQQHPQQSQHPQHPQQPDQHPAYQDQNRLWQQQMQFRPRSGMDINQQQQQQPQQVQDMFRARHGSQNQPMGPQSQPQFGLGMSSAQMPSAGAMKPLPSNQQQPFADSAAAQSQSSHMQTAGFANMGSLPNQNPGLNAAPMPQRNSNIFVMQNGPMGKQLERMLAQQSTNNVVFHPAKLNQQNPQMQQVQQQQQPSQQQVQTEMFSSPVLSGGALRGPSPSHPPQMQASLQGPQQHPGPGVLHPQGMPPRRNQAALQELTERLKAARQNVLSSEAELRAAMNQMHTQPAEVTQNIQGMQNDLKMKQEIFQQLQRQQQLFLHDGAIANNIGRLGSNNVPGQPTWGPQNGPSQNFENGGGMGRGGAHLQNPHQPGPQPPNGMQPNSSLQPSPNNNHLLASGGVPRQGQTPNPPGIQPPQQLGSPFPGQMNVPANMSNKTANFPLGAYMGANPAAVAAAAAAMNQRTLNSIGFPPPLDKGKFNATLPGFLQKRGIKIDPGLLRLNDQQIDLANLHALVISEGGYNKVHENGLWDVIGGRMGFVNFPGSDHEPAKSGPVVAQNLAHVYREYLLELESAYLRTWITNAQLRMGNPAMQHGGGPGGLPNGIGIANNGQATRFSPQLLQYAHMSTAELRQRHVPENVIAMVDQIRPQLQRTIMEQKRFQQQPPNQGTVMNDAGQPTGSAAMMLRQQVLKHPIMNGAGGMDARFGPFPGQYPHRNLEMTKNAMEAINRMKEDCKKGPQLARFMQANIEIPYDQQAEFNRLLDATYRQAQELDQKLHLLHVILPSCTQRVIVISNIVATQRQLKSTSQPRYILSLELLRNLASELQRIVEMFTTAHMQKQYARMQPPGQQHQIAQGGQVPNQPPQPPGMSNHPAAHPHSQPPPSVPNNMNGTAHSPPASNMLNHRHSPMQPHALQQHPPPPPQQQQQQPMQVPPQQGLQVSQPHQAPSPSQMSSSRGAITLQAPPPKRKAQNPPTPSNTAPSPAAGASTPVPVNAPTPTATASSPPAPKSPKGKAKAKQTTSKRKMSTAPSAPAAPSAAPAPAPTQAPPEPVQPQPPTLNGSGKRPREEDAPNGNIASSPAGTVVDQPSPPKRSKVEWGEGPQSEELQQKKGQIENIKTEEDTSQFLEEFIKIVGGDPVRDTNGFAELSMLLKECTQPGSVDDLSSFPPLEPPPMMKDELEQYFDFSLGGEEDDSKTPELVPSSSTTDTSPGSNSGNEPTSEGAAQPISNELKNEESLDFTHLTHLGLWSGVDGGESAYYQTSDWRFDNTMATQDPWAISTS